jgi:hypothetical protein
MKTPYDAALRVKRREVDAMGAAINAQMTTVNQLDMRQVQIRSNMQQEALVAANDLALSGHAYMARLRAEQLRLAGERMHQDELLAQLRIAASAAFGSFRTIEMAAEDYRHDAERRLANAEQAELDDSSAAAFLNARKVMHARSQR